MRLCCRYQWLALKGIISISNDSKVSDGMARHFSIVVAGIHSVFTTSKNERSDYFILIFSMPREDDPSLTRPLYAREGDTERERER
jgi:hypothetical protein